MTAVEPAARPTAGQVAVLLTTGSRRGRRGAHRRSAGRPASPRIAAAATILAVAAAVTVAALPSTERSSIPQPSVRSEPVSGVVPQPDASSWSPASAVVPVDRVTAALGEGAEAARRRAAAVATSLTIPKRSARR